MVRPRGLEPPLVAQLAPQASASTNSAMAAETFPASIEIEKELSTLYYRIFFFIAFSSRSSFFTPPENAQKAKGFPLKGAGASSNKLPGRAQDRQEPEAFKLGRRGQANTVAYVSELVSIVKRHL